MKTNDYPGKDWITDQVHSFDWAHDSNKMLDKFKQHGWMAEREFDGEWHMLKEFLEFRMNFLQEELDETTAAVKNKDAEEVVDGLIDLCVIAIGTLNLYGVDAHQAWTEVHRANMDKEPGIKPARPNPLNLPDMVKPSDWQGPEHHDNVGIIQEVLDRG